MLRLGLETCEVCWLIELFGQSALDLSHRLVCLLSHILIGIVIPDVR